MKYVWIAAAFLGKVFFFSLGTLVAYYTFATVIGGIASLSTWSLSIMKELYIFWEKPSTTYYAFARCGLWLLGIGGGISVIKGSKE